MKTLVEQCGNEDFNTIHADVVLSEKHLSTLYNSDWEKKGYPVFVAEIMAIPGVIGMFADKYHVAIEKAKLFDWTPINDAAIAILEKHFAKS